MIYGKNVAGVRRLLPAWESRDLLFRDFVLQGTTKA